MNLLPEEPSFAPWNVASLDDFVTALSASKSAESIPKIIAIDGRSAGGKTSLAARVHHLIPGSVVYTLMTFPPVHPGVAPKRKRPFSATLYRLTHLSLTGQIELSRIYSSRFWRLSLFTTALNPGTIGIEERAQLRFLLVVQL